MQQLLMYCTHRKIYHKTRIKHSWIHSGCLKSASWLHSSDNHHLQVAQVNIFAAVILQFAKPLHHWSVRSDALNSSFAMFAYSRNRVTVKFWRQYLQNLQSYLEIFIIHLAAAVTLLQTDSISSVSSLSTYFRDMTCFDGFYLKKSRSTCSVLEQNIDISFGPNGAPLGSRWWSTLRAASRSY